MMRYLLVFVIICVLTQKINAGLNTASLHRLHSLTEVIEKYNEEEISLTLQNFIRSVNIDELSLYIYTKENLNGTQISLTNVGAITTLSSFNLNHKTVFYIHGWLEEAVDSNGTILIKNALLQANEDLNVLVLDWDKCATNILYTVSYGCVPDVGKYLGDFILQLSETFKYSLGNITLIGHSLGAHIAGFSGKQTSGKIGSIVALDPAGPLYFKGLPDTRLTENSAVYVEAIHTSASFLGVNYEIAVSDFWPNGGHTQPGCGFDPFGECAHKRSWDLYAESIKYNNFIAKQCDSNSNFENGACQNNAKSWLGGINVDDSAEESYYLETNSQSPFGKGDI